MTDAILYTLVALCVGSFLGSLYYQYRNGGMR